MSPGWRRGSLGLLGAAIVLTAWQLTSLVVGKSAVLPSFGQTGKAFYAALDDGLLYDVSVSLLRVCCGFLIAAIVAVVVATLLSASSTGTSMLLPTLELLRPIPPLAWVPLSLLWFGFGTMASVFVVAVGAVFPTLFGCMEAYRVASSSHFENAELLGVRGWRYHLMIRSPAALPGIVTSMRLGMGTAWTSVIAAELVGATNGLGYLIQERRLGLDTPGVVVGMLSIGLVGLVLTSLLALVELAVQRLIRGSQVPVEDPQAG